MCAGKLIRTKFHGKLNVIFNFLISRWFLTMDSYCYRGTTNTGDRSTAATTCFLNKIVQLIFNPFWYLSYQVIKGEICMHVILNVRKHTFWYVRKTQTQISLCIRAVRLESSWSAWRNFASSSIQSASVTILIKPGWFESSLGANVRWYLFGC